MRIILLGAKGMLGQMAHSYFAQLHEIVEIKERFNFTATCPAIREVSEAGPGFVINCIGRIKQKDATRQDLYDANAILPLQLADCLTDGQFLIQPSTDCVFSGGQDSFYDWDAVCDATDDYGWSKRLGEIALEGRPNATIVRVSIIGEDRIDPDPKGLLGWFLNQPDGASLKGFQNHHWNGITTLEWCKMVEEHILNASGNQWNGKILQLGTQEAISKYNMLRQFQECYGRIMSITPFNTEEAVFRCLRPQIISPELPIQLEEMRVFYAQ